MEKDKLERLVEVEQRSKSNMKRLDEHDTRFKEVDVKLDVIHELTYSIKEIANEVKLMREDVNKLDKRVENIEQEPAKDYKDTKKLVKNQIIGFSLGIVLTILALKLGLGNYL